MTKSFSPALDDVVKRLSKLPGIGKKAALRLAVHLLELPQTEVDALSDAIRQIKKQISECSICGSWTEQDPCAICTSVKRETHLICVIETPADVIAIENSGFRGYYHVLGGCLSPLDDIGPEQLRIRELLQRIHQGQYSEVIVATNPTTEGDATSLYLLRLLESIDIKVTRIAFGIPIGSDVRLADEESLSQSLSGRKDMRPNK